MAQQARVIEASVRFLRSNPDLLAYAQHAVASTGRTVDELLADAAERFGSALERVAQEQVLTGTAR